MKARRRLDRAKKNSVSEDVIARQQRAVHELEILNELMGFVTSGTTVDVVLKNLVLRVKDFSKADYCAVIIFEPESFAAKIFVTCEDIQDPSSVCLNPEGFFKGHFKNLVPLRLPPQQQDITESTQQSIKIPDLNLEVKNILAVPFVFPDALSGIFLLANKLKGSFNQEDEDLLKEFTSRVFQIIAMHEKIMNLTITDSLTGLNNHRYFHEKLKDEVELARRYEKNLSILIVDIDNFKHFNDVHGHQAGDVILKSIASVIKGQVRNTDFPVRYGSEEFAAIMPETSYDGARILAERMRRKIAETPFSLLDDDRVLITVSIGFASTSKNTKDKAELIEMAERALYFAKKRGRNLSCGCNDD